MSGLAGDRAARPTTPPSRRCSRCSARPARATGRASIAGRSCPPATRRGTSCRSAPGGWPGRRALRTSRSRAGRIAGSAVDGLVRSGARPPAPVPGHGRAAEGSIVELLRARLDRPRLQVAVGPRAAPGQPQAGAAADRRGRHDGRLRQGRHRRAHRRAGRAARASSSPPPAVPARGWCCPRRCSPRPGADHELSVVERPRCGARRHRRARRDRRGDLGDRRARSDERGAGARERVVATHRAADRRPARVDSARCSGAAVTGPTTVLAGASDQPRGPSASGTATSPAGTRSSAAGRSWCGTGSGRRAPCRSGLDAVHAHFQPPLLNDGRTGPESASLALAGAGPVLTDLGHAASCACGRDRLPPRAAAAPGRGRDQGRPRRRAVVRRRGRRGRHGVEADDQHDSTGATRPHEHAASSSATAGSGRCCACASGPRGRPLHGGRSPTSSSSAASAAARRRSTATSCSTRRCCSRA